MERPDRHKIFPFPALSETVAAFRKRNERIVMCDGTFDVIHVGHIRHLEAAKREGDRLVVTVTQDEHVRRGPGHPVFSLPLRMEALASLECVDVVVANPWPTAAQAIADLRPDVFARGPEYEDQSAEETQSLHDERDAVEQAGGRFVITTDISYRTSDVVGHQFSSVSPDAQEYLHAFRGRHGPSSVAQWLEKAQDLRVLVVGEAIIDDYHYVEAIGKSSKEPVLATRNVSSEVFAGGILAVANNVAGFARQVDLVSVVGSDGEYADFIDSSLRENVSATFIEWPATPTIAKRRYIESYSFSKLFEVYDMPDGHLPREQTAQLNDALSGNLGHYDLVIVVDFGHGMIGNSTIEILCEQSRFLALNVQSNAGNHGYNTLSKFPRADFISAAENEIRLETRDRRGSLRSIIKQVAEQLTAPNVIVTRGKFGCLCYGQGVDTVEIPALAGEVVDRVGAGDAFLSVSALLASLGAPIEIVGFIGNAASAQAVATVGHQRSIDRLALIRHVNAMLR